MKMKTRFALTAIILTLSLAGSTIIATPPDCAVGNLHFACPKNFKILPLESAQQFTLFYWKKYDVGLFVASRPSGSDELTFMTNVTQTALTKMFPKESQAFSWKPVDYSGRISKFEIGGGVSQGFNGSLGVLIKYRRLKFNGREIIVGYASEFGRGADAKEAFDRALGGDSMPGCYAVVDVTYSITGEKMPENNPCDLISEIG
jgi:hypothetical protein